MANLHALLLTDVVDSTRLIEQLDEAGADDLWSSHNRLARDLLPRWCGREIDKTDGMLLLFQDVKHAVGYALAYHEALRESGLGIKARAGIHFGAASLRSNSPEDVARGAKPIEVNGIAVPMVARIMSIAGGEQTLLSEDARRALDLSPLRIQSHGHWLLHGIAQPVELFEIADGQRPFTPLVDAPKAFRVVRQGDLWQPLRDVRHTLPAERDGFVGRQDMLAALAAKLVGGARLVSILGTGGVGKTRLATRFAWTRRAEYVGSVWFCDLSQARGIDGILFAVAQGLEVPLGQADPVVQLGQAIAGRGRCLIVLDNFEQVTRHAEETLGRWLERAPHAQFIVTTREVLGIVGEEVLAIPPLDRDAAVELFLKRARAARQGHGSGLEDLSAVGQLVKVLDCLPLAIELAAARVRIMSPRTLLARMRDRFDVLLSSAGRRDRQATLRAAFDWSWELLSEHEKAAFAQLSVFEGGFTLESADAVLAVKAVGGAPYIVNLVQGLVDKSFVRQVNDERFDLLESLREYAAQHLRTVGRFEGSGPASDADARSRHWRYFARTDERAAVANRCAELNNLVAAARAAAAADDGPSAVDCLVAAWAALRLTGPYRAGVDLAALVQRVNSLDNRSQALVHWVAGDALDVLGDVALARIRVELGLQLAELAQDRTTTARLLIVRGSRQGLDGELDGALASLTEACRLSEVQEEEGLHAAALIVLGRLMEYQSRFAESRRYYGKALELARARGDRRMEGGVLGNLGGIHHALGEVESANRHYERAVALASEVGDRRWEGNGRCNLGLLFQEQGKTAEARTQFDMALHIARDIGHLRLENVVLCNLGILLTSEHRLNEAAQALEQAIKGAVAASDRRAEGQARGYMALVLAKQGSMAEARAMADLGESLLIASADALSRALLLCDRATIELLAADITAAEVAMKHAAGIADEMDCGPESELRRRLAAIATNLTVHEGCR